MHQLEAIGKTTPTLALMVDDRVGLVPPREIIMFDVSGVEITMQTTKKIYHVRGQLKRTLAKLNVNDFVQVSKNAVLNLNYLETLEASFSGNMMAHLSNGLKVMVSRKYLPALKTKLGM